MSISKNGKWRVCFVFFTALLLIFSSANVTSAKSGTSNRGPVKSTIRVERVTGITKNTVRGVDISTLISEEQSGVKYYNSKGKKENLVKLLKQSGVNYVRIRIWNDPYNSKGQGYGAGNSDLSKAIQIGRLATKYKMKVLIDFHYSDFWADPGKQTPPKAWANYSLDQKISAVHQFTYDSLKKLKKAKVNVGMVQIGNETNGFFIGETNWSSICQLFTAGSKAVRQVMPNASVVLHFTNPERVGFETGVAQTLKNNNVDYD
ncbi:MAG: secreted arabinogalactan oligomer endo-hydrolase, partial [Sporolactobacillus laevolacticus]|nr:secreted arabinogalactan oligomer endo-hydrolase [Sporolactobacillus laevolacticus]